MVSKQELVRMLVEALSFEEVTIIARLEAFLRETRDSDMDETIKIEIDKKIGHMLVESVEHSKALTETVKKVMSSEQDEY